MLYFVLQVIKEIDDGQYNKKNGSDIGDNCSVSANHRPTFKASNYFLHLFPCTGTKSRKGYLV